METKDWLIVVLGIWGNTIATIVMITTRKDKKTAKRKPSKRKR